MSGEVICSGEWVAEASGGVPGGGQSGWQEQAGTQKA